MKKPRHGRNKGGRPRKPTALHKLHGTDRADRNARPFEPQPETDLDVVPPDFLTPSQKEGWTYVMRYAPRGLLKALDRSVLVTWVEAEDRHRTAMMTQARLDLGNQMPLLTKSKDGSPTASPYLRIMNHAALIMLRCGSELGFSPASRPRIQLIPQGGPRLIEGEVDAWDELTRDVA
jgi:P27 family predicted phage terminase small subunit